MRRLFVISILCLTSLIPLFADDFDRIVQIKLASDQYLWGEARFPDQEDANTFAKEMLLEQVKEWLAENQSSLNAEHILSACSVLSVRRGSMYLSLAYISKEDIGKEPELQSVVGQESGKVQKRFTSEDATVVLLTSETIEELKGQLLKEPMASSCQWGEIDEKTSPSQLSDAYLVIFNPSSSKIVCVLSPRKSRRVNLFTGNNDSTSNYPGHRAYWIIVNE